MSAHRAPIGTAQQTRSHARRVPSVLIPSPLRLVRAEDTAALPMRPVFNSTDGLQVWLKQLAVPATSAVILFHRTIRTEGPLPSPPAVREITATWDALGFAAGARVAVRDLWARTSLGTFQSKFTANVTEREAKIYTFAVQAAVAEHAK